MAEAAAGPPALTAVVCTYGREALALRAVASVLEDDSFEDYELLVVDQDPSRSLGRALSERWPDHPKLRYLYCREVGLSHGRNLAARQARGGWLVFLDDDAVALPGWLRGYRQAFQTTPPPQMVGGRILPEWECPPPAWFPESQQFLLGLYDIGGRMQPFPSTHLPVGANFAVRREVLDSVGGFAVELGFKAGRRGALGGEDSLVAMRVLAAGGVILYQPEATVRHLVRKEKLRLSAFIRRHFVEGRTQIAVYHLTHRDQPSYYRGVAQWHLKALLLNLLAMTRALLRARSGGLGPAVEALAAAALSAGIIRESTGLLGRRMAAGPGTEAGA